MRTRTRVLEIRQQLALVGSPERPLTDKAREASRILLFSDIPWLLFVLEKLLLERKEGRG
jgi:hypothetical protein